MAEIKRQEAQHGHCDSSSEEHERVQRFTPIRLVVVILQFGPKSLTSQATFSILKSWLLEHFL